MRPVIWLPNQEISLPVSAPGLPNMTPPPFHPRVLRQSSADLFMYWKFSSGYI